MNCGCKKVTITVNKDGSYSFSGITEDEFLSIFPNSEIAIDESGNVRIKNVFSIQDEEGILYSGDGNFDDDLKFTGSRYIEINGETDEENSKISGFVKSDGVVSTVAENSLCSSWALTDGVLYRPISEGSGCDLLSLSEVAESMSEEDKDSVRVVVYDISKIDENLSALSSGASKFNNLSEIFVIGATADLFSDTRFNSSVVMAEFPVTFAVNNRFKIISGGGSTKIVVGSVISDEEVGIISLLYGKRDELSLSGIEVSPIRKYGVYCTILPLFAKILDSGVSLSKIDIVTPFGSYSGSTGKFVISGGPGWGSTWGICGYDEENYIPNPLWVGSTLGIISRVVGGMTLTSLSNQCLYYNAWAPYAYLFSAGTIITDSSCSNGMTVTEQDGKFYISNPVHSVIDEVITNAFTVTVDNNGEEKDIGVYPIDVYGRIYGIEVFTPSGHTVEEYPSFNRKLLPHTLYVDAKKVIAYTEKQSDDLDDMEAFSRSDISMLRGLMVDEAEISVVVGNQVRNTYTFSSGYSILEIAGNNFYPSMLYWIRGCEEVSGMFGFSGGTLTMYRVSDISNIVSALSDKVSVVDLSSGENVSYGTDISGIGATVILATPTSDANCKKLGDYAYSGNASVALANGADIDIAVMSGITDWRVGRFASIVITKEGEDISVEVDGGRRYKSGTLFGRVEEASVAIMQDIVDNGTIGIDSVKDILENSSVSVSDNGSVSLSFCRKFNCSDSNISATDTIFFQCDSSEEFQSFDDIKSKCCSSGEEGTYYATICKVSVSGDDPADVVFSSAQDIRLHDIETIPCDSGSAGNILEKEHPSTGAFVEYSISKSGDTVIVEYRAIDGDGNDITDTIKTVSVADGFYYLGE